MFARKYKGVFHMLLRIRSFMYAPIASRLESLRPPPPCHLHSKYFSYAATYWSLSRLSDQEESRKPLGSGRHWHTSTFFFFFFWRFSSSWTNLDNEFNTPTVDATRISSFLLRSALFLCSCCIILSLTRRHNMNKPVVTAVEGKEPRFWLVRKGPGNL